MGESLISDIRKILSTAQQEIEALLKSESDRWPPDVFTDTDF